MNKVWKCKHLTSIVRWFVLNRDFPAITLFNICINDDMCWEMMMLYIYQEAGCSINVCVRKYMFNQLIVIILKYFLWKGVLFCKYCVFTYSKCSEWLHDVLLIKVSHHILICLCAVFFLVRWVVSTITINIYIKRLLFHLKMLSVYI